MIILVTLLVLSLPLMVVLVLYNVFGNCRNVIDKTMVDNEEYADRDIEDLPPEIDSIEKTIFSCDPSLTLKKLQSDLSTVGRLDLSGKPEMLLEELENLTVLLLSLNPRKFRMKELNLDDSRLTVMIKRLKIFYFFIKTDILIIFLPLLMRKFYLLAGRETEMFGSSRSEGRLI